MRGMTPNDHPAGDLHLATVVVNVKDMERAVRFWSAALGYRQREQEWDPEFMMLVDSDGRRTPLSLQPTDADFVVLRDPDGNEFCVIDHAVLQVQPLRAPAPSVAR